MAPAKPRRGSELRSAQRFRVWDGVFTKGVETLTGGAFLAGFALALGADNVQIGLIASIPFLAQIVNVPAIWIVERVRRRRLLCVIGSSISRTLWIPIALSPLVLPSDQALIVLMAALGLAATVAAISGLSWNSWMKDLLPGPLRGRLFSSRLWAMGVAGMLMSLAAAFLVDLWKPAEAILPLSTLFMAGAVIGWIGLFFLARIPEPPMPAHARFSLRKALAEPFRDHRFRQLISFTSVWAFASNMALPFIPVYMLSILGYPFSYVMGFTVASQLANLLLLQIWGRLADRYGNKAVLTVCAPVFSVAILLWALTVGDHSPWITLPLIGLIHVMLGMTVAGIDVANSNVLYHIAPHRQSSAYFSAAALVNSLAAGIAPILGGLLASALTDRALTLSWGSTGGANHWPLVEISRLDFVFLAAFATGLIALSRLGRVRERAQEATHAQVIKSLKDEVTNLSTIKGMRYLTQTASFLAGLLMESGSVVTRNADVHGSDEDEAS